MKGPTLTFNYVGFNNENELNSVGIDGFRQHPSQHLASLGCLRCIRQLCHFIGAIGSKTKVVNRDFLMVQACIFIMLGQDEAAPSIL